MSESSLDEDEVRSPIKRTKTKAASVTQPEALSSGSSPMPERRRRAKRVCIWQLGLQGLHGLVNGILLFINNGQS